ncbi:unnamed protein product [Phytomonas sp. Hart1]|nr:unnamed protein product [Phytomonas sp. Hart1]|eukprot:CCW71163.1 unnamed protein product [Phytomonas sp. isolate Hart1]
MGLTTTPSARGALWWEKSAYNIHLFAGQEVNWGLYNVCASERVLRIGQDINSVVMLGQVFSWEMIAHTGHLLATVEII